MSRVSSPSRRLPAASAALRSRVTTERLDVLVGFVAQYGPTCNERDGTELAGDDAQIRAARDIAVCSAFEAIRRIADAS